MTGTTPPPPPADLGPPNQPPWVTDLGPGDPQPYQREPSSGRWMKALVLTTVLVLFVGGGALAFFKVDPFHLFRAGPQAAEAIPANAVLYAGLDLDPKASQKVAALRFLNHFPAFRDNAGLTDANADIADQVVGKAIDDLDCQGLTYADDVKPWLGQRFGIAVMPSTGASDQPVVVAVQTSDDDAARSGIEALNRCDDAASAVPTSDTLGVAFANGFMLLAETQARADAYARSADAHSLADDADFKADMDSLGDLGVATMWVDVAGTVRAYADDVPAGSMLSSVTSAAGRVAATFRFASDHVEMATSIHGDTPVVDHDDNPIVGLPDTTVFAFSASGAGERIASAWQQGLAQVRKTDPSVEAQLDQFASATGISLPADLRTLFGENLMLALDQQGLSADELGAGDISKLNLGLRLTNDPAKLNALYGKVTDLIRQAAGTDVGLSKQDFADGIAIASNDAYAQTLADLGGDLGDSDAFTSVVDDAASQEFVMFFNFDAIKDQVLDTMAGEGAAQEAMDNVRPLKALGITSSVDGEYQHLTLRLSVDD